MLQQEQPEDFVIATGETHSVREFVELAFKEVGIDITWQGQGIDEKGIDKETGNIVVAVDKKYFRPTEVDLLIGDPSKAKQKLGWSAKTTFKDLVKLMIQEDLKIVKKEIKKIIRNQPNLSNLIF